jgi:hypothetical protein
MKKNLKTILKNIVMKESKFMKFWGKYGYIFFLVSGGMLFFTGEKLLGITNILLGISFYGAKD